MRTIADMGGTTKPLLASLPPDQEPYGYLNPSVGYSPETGYQVLVRSANYRVGREDYTTKVYGSHYILNRNYLADLTDDDKLVNSRLISEEHGNPNLHRGLEDGRIVWNTENSAWDVYATLYEPPFYPDATVGRYSLDPETCRATYVEDYRSPRATAEKNWMAPTEPGSFEFVYDAFHSLTRGELTGHLSPIERPELMYLHGGTQLLAQDDGTYLAVVHEVTNEPTETDYHTRMKNFWLSGTSRRVYHHYFAEYSAEGGLQRLSDPFFFHHRGIEFAAGMVQRGDDLLITYGENDETVNLATIPKERFLSELRPATR